MLALAGSLAATTVLAQDMSIKSGQHRLLALDGRVVKWGPSKLGTGAVVRYALAGGTIRSEGAINCGVLNSFEKLARSMDVADEIVEEELQGAMQAWEAVADISFERVSDTAKADLIIGTQALLRGRAYANVMPHHFAGFARRSVGKGIVNSLGEPSGRRSEIAVRRQSPMAIAPIRQSLICLNVNSGWKIGYDGDLRRYDLRHTFMHELGHAIGLDHPGVRTELMDFRYHEAFKGLQYGDVKGAALLYGPPKTTEKRALTWTLLLHLISGRISLKASVPALASHSKTTISVVTMPAPIACKRSRHAFSLSSVRDDVASVTTKT